MVTCILLSGIIIPGLLIGACMRILYMCSIARLSGLNPSHPLVPRALAFMDEFGGVEKVERGARTGIEIFLPVFLLSSLGLLIHFIAH